MSATQANGRDAGSALRRITRWSLFPLLVVGMGTFAVQASTWRLDVLLGLPAGVNDALLPLVAIIVFYSLVALLERRLPYRPAWNSRHGDVQTDTLHLIFSGPLSSAFFDASLRGSMVAGGVWLSARWGTGLWPSHWPAVLQLGLALLVAELGHYWFHRVSHEHELVWRVHAAHHSAPRLYWLNATRFHPLDLFSLITCQTTPLLLLGADRRAQLMYTLFAVVYGQLQHCNIDVQTWRLVDWVFSTPGLHRWHHSTDTREGNHNYGAILSAWDLLFGTFFRPQGRAFAGRVGIGDLPGFPPGYLGQLLSPFRWARIRREAAEGAGA